MARCSRRHGLCPRRGRVWTRAPSQPGGAERRGWHHCPGVTISWGQTGPRRPSGAWGRPRLASAAADDPRGRPGVRLYLHLPPGSPRRPGSCPSPPPRPMLRARGDRQRESPLSSWSGASLRNGHCAWRFCPSSPTLKRGGAEAPETGRAPGAAPRSRRAADARAGSRRCRRHHPFPRGGPHRHSQTRCVCELWFLGVIVENPKTFLKVALEVGLKPGRAKPSPLRPFAVHEPLAHLGGDTESWGAHGAGSDCGR